MRRVAAPDRNATVRMAWRVAGAPSPDAPPADWGGRTPRASTLPARQIAAFVEGCRHISAESAPTDAAPVRLASAGIWLPTQEDLRQRMQAAATDAVVASAPQRASLLSRVASWVGLVPEKTSGTREGLLEGLIRSGVPLREELLEHVGQFHAQLQAWQLARDVMGRARQGAALLTQLQTMGELLVAAQQLRQSGHGQSAGLDPALLQELAQHIESTQVAVARVVALPIEHASFVKDVQGSWAQALGQVRDV